MGAHQGGEEAESEDKEEGEYLGRIFSFYYSLLTEMMSAPNEFPSRVPLAVKGRKNNTLLSERLSAPPGKRISPVSAAPTVTLLA